MGRYFVDFPWTCVGWLKSSWTHRPLSKTEGLLEHNCCVQCYTYVRHQSQLSQSLNKNVNLRRMSKEVWERIACPSDVDVLVEFVPTVTVDCKFVVTTQVVRHDEFMEQILAHNWSLICATMESELVQVVPAPHKWVDVCKGDNPEADHDSPQTMRHRPKSRRTECLE